MYNAYFLNTVTGKIFRSSSPSKNPKGKDWKQVSFEEFQVFEKIADYAMHGWYDVCSMDEYKNEES